MEGSRRKMEQINYLLHSVIWSVVCWWRMNWWYLHKQINMKGDIIIYHVALLWIIFV